MRAVLILLLSVFFGAVFALAVSFRMDVVGALVVAAAGTAAIARGAFEEG